MVDIVIWKEKNEIVLADNGDAMIANFNTYRNNVLTKKYRHDIAELITRTAFGYYGL